MTRPHKLRYLSRAEVAGLGMPMAEVIAAVELALREKAAGRTMMPAKHWIPASPRRFFSAMSSAIPGISATGCKWQSGSPDNAAQGQPYITGQYILNSMATGLPLAIMDSTWITEMRTAAASAVAARSLCAKPARTFGIVGCGLQARRHLEALRAVFPRLNTVRAYDISRTAAEKFAADAKQQFGADVTVCDDAKAAFAGADVAVTAGPIIPDGARIAEASWLTPGAVAVTIDYDCYWKPHELGKLDALVTDDVAQLEHSKPDGYFVTVPSTIEELAPVVAGTRSIRTSPEQRIGCINLGLALEDVATALALYERATKANAGVELPI